MTSVTPEHTSTDTGCLDGLLAYVEAAALPTDFARNPQVGLYYVAQAAVDAGYAVRIDTLCSNDHLVERLTRLLIEAHCRTLGLYVDQDNFWVLRRVIPELLGKLPDLAVVLGGPQATAAPEQVLEGIPGARCAAIGEGEYTFVELLGIPALAIDALLHVPGLAVNTPSGVVRTSARPPINDLDALSIPRRSELDIDFEPRVSPTLISGRGCHGTCAFCFEGRHPVDGGRRLRLHSVERTLEEFDYLLETYESKYISIVDDAFVTTPSRVRQFCAGLTERYGGKVKWYCEARVDSLSRHLDLLPIMVEAGLLRVQVGAESGSQAVLDAYRKRTTLEQMRDVVDAAGRCGLLSLYGNFIVGGAFETRATYEESVSFALELLERAPGCAAFGSSIFTPYPGTPMTASPEVYGIQVVDQYGVMSIGDQHASCRTEELSRLDILGLRADFDRRVHDHMKLLARDLPRTTVMRHFDAFALHHVQTEWYDVLSRNRAAQVYFASLCNQLAMSWADASQRDPDRVFPIRTVDPVASTGDRFLIRNWCGVASELDPLTGLILELSAGKLSLSEILNILTDEYPSLSFDALFRSVAARFAHLDADGLVVWTTVH